MKAGQLITANFAVTLLIACALGFVIPDVGSVMPHVIVGILALIVFSSFFRLSLDFRVLGGHIRQALLFFVLRFLALPLAVFLVLNCFESEYAGYFLLLLLLPTGVSAPAISTLFRSDIELALTIVTVSHALVVATIPVAFVFWGGEAGVEPVMLFRTLVLTVLVPFVLHLPFRRSLKIKSFIASRVSLIAVLGLSAIFMLVVAHNRAFLLRRGFVLVGDLGLLLAVYAVLYFTGWLLSRRAGHARGVSYSFCSGLNNIGLGLSLASLYFPSDWVSFFLVGEFAWILVLWPVRQFFARALGVIARP